MGSITAPDWWKLPLPLRRRWWAETEYGAKPPGEELKSAIAAALGLQHGGEIMTFTEERPKNRERSHSVQMGVCKDPNCGLHLLALRADGSEICEIVLSPKMVTQMIEMFCGEKIDDGPAAV